MSKKGKESQQVWQEPFPYKTYDEILMEKDRHIRFRHGMIVVSGIFLMFCAVIIGISMIWNHSANPFRPAVEHDHAEPQQPDLSDMQEPEAPSQNELQEDFEFPSVQPDLTPGTSENTAFLVADVSGVVREAREFVVGVESESYHDGIVSNSGSGIVLSEDGYILTSSRIIQNGDGINVTLADGSSYAAFVIGDDPYSDIAVLRIDADGLTAAAIGDSDRVQVGEAAIALGYVTGQPQFMATFGVISGVGWSVPVRNSVMNLLQTDAAINAQNSGGPLLNRFGQVIGINVLEDDGSACDGIGFAIPINIVRPIAEELVRSGTVESRPVLGVTAERLSAMASRFYGFPQGLLLSAVDPRSGAALSGLHVGDVITHINDNRIASIADAAEIRNQFRAGTQISVTFYRHGLTKTVSVVLMDQKNAAEACNF